MRWEELTGDRFAEAVKECEGVCLIALSVVERHGHHLPLGTDKYIGREIVNRAAIEPAIVFPDYVFTQIPEVRHRAGTICIDADLVLLDKVPDDDEGKARERLKALREVGVQTGVWWYVDYPTHYAGDARQANAEVGDRLLDACAEELAKAVRATKADTEAKRLQAEFFAGSQAPF